MAEQQRLVANVEDVPLAELRPHPRNYRDHPEDQLEHLAASLEQHGLYRNVVVARDGTILAGHGVVRAAGRLGWKTISVVRIDIDPDDPRAIKLLVGDNETSRLAMIDDRGLTTLLDELQSMDGTMEPLLGTGFDERMLSALLYNTRPASEIADEDAAAHWVGMPEYEDGSNALRLVMLFSSVDDRRDFVAKSGLADAYGGAGKLDSDKQLISAWWPPRAGREDKAAYRFEGSDSWSDDGQPEP